MRGLNWKINVQIWVVFVQGGVERVGLISHECYPYRARHSAKHRGCLSQSNGWDHSSSTAIN